jgi:hypothetical protein
MSQDRVWIYNQKYTIPNDPGLFVEVACLGRKVFSNQIRSDEDEAGNFCEFQSMNVQEINTVRLYSRDESAYTRAHEVVFALNSTEAQQMAEAYSFKFGFIPTGFTDTSFLEASARLFRQDLTFQILRMYTKKRVIEYYDKFPIPPEIYTNP